MNSMSKDLASSFQYIDDSRSLWDEIQNRFDRCSGPKLYQLERDLSRCVQNNSTVMDYFSSISSIWDEINILSPNPVCSCVVCTCGASQALKQMIEKRKVNQFLLGLNDNFDTVRSQILLMEPLPNVSKVYSLVLQDEDQRKVATHTSTFGESAMMANKPSQPASNRTQAQKNFGSGFRRPRLSKEERRNLRCSHCGVNGHEARECFKLHGIPDWFKELKEQKIREQAFFIGGNQNFNSGTSGNSCSNMEQIIKEEVQKCISKISYGKTPVDADEQINLVNSGSNPLKSYEGHFSFGIMDAISSHQWILDSGASVHICSDEKLLKSVRKLDQEQKVFLPDGSAQVVQFVGSAQLTTKLILEDVLLAPSFTHNLVSVAELAKQLDVKCTFLKSHCLIQKRTGDSLIGMAKACGKLYLIDSGNLNFINTITHISGLSAVD